MDYLPEPHVVVIFVNGGHILLHHAVTTIILVNTPSFYYVESPSDAPEGLFFCSEG